ncbi:hypothetical protein MMAD_38570 [Mycolicibacterium madagascariense]|uniref:Uncharacterized protein n=1 Tax=Mycolicibacterium madagascariense TaxID=212765 RepID=A0A7I7XKA8_9MYCO|nr:hypothetical protein [Mycolicibacterium madagascariense]MCV7011209.1 hypothetical protein [Mycolicibacterium madagascariense]BBZ29562.1 hypothetical protein MMAD_38570 [Mycolicibacterium madagascariense]
MSVIRTATVAAVEQVFIEEIQNGDWVVSTRTGGNGDPCVWQVHAKGFKWSQADGGLITLRSKAATGEESGVVSAPPRTRILRARLAPAPIYTEVPDELVEDENTFRHKKCYANTRGGCSTKISGEHFVSQCLIDLYSFDDPDVKIKHDSGYGVQSYVSAKQFKTNILCEKHNNDLHIADDAALQFATFIRGIALEYRNGAGEWGTDDEITVSGEDFQNWVLKLILNHAVGKAFNGTKTKFPPEAVDLLLGRAMWPRTWGLCVAGDLSHDELRYRPFERVEDSTTDFWSVSPLLHRDGWVGGGIVNLNGIGLGLTVFNPSRDNPDAFDNNLRNPLRGSIQRPGFMAWELDGVTKRINFEWNDVWQHRTITYKMSRD